MDSVKLHKTNMVQIMLQEKGRRELSDDSIDNYYSKITSGNVNEAGDIFNHDQRNRKHGYSSKKIGSDLNPKLEDLREKFVGYTTIKPFVDVGANDSFDLEPRIASINKIGKTPEDAELTEKNATHKEFSETIPVIFRVKP
ncbi:hypothetical protein RF11_06770 [Thelohanellus kitauei]|uniref:Uncharacterized protein n=1 Tax=Thelohanellus kitauei TaxID=669202 RepID=A0A0C2MM77_THEKT|nr:hypothetical protein RF11_06770 [Thelohanellus kitauei]